MGNKKINLKTKNWLKKLLKKQGKGVAFLTLLGFLLSILGLLRTICYKEIIDMIKPVIEGEGTGRIALWIISFAVIVLISVLTSTSSSYLKELTIVNTLNNVRGEILNSIYKKEYKKISAYHSGDILNRVFSDARIVSNNLVTLVPSVISVFVKLSGSFLLLYFLSPKIAVAILIFGIIIFGGAMPFKKKIKKIHTDTQEAEGNVRTVFQEQNLGLLMIKIFGAYGKMQNKADMAQKEYKKKFMRQKFFSCLMHLAYVLAYNFAIVVVFIYAVYSIINGNLGYGSLTAMLQLANIIQHSISEVSGIFPKYVSTLASGDRITEILNLPEEEIREQHIHSFDKISFDNVSFTYGREFALKNINLSINKGEVVAILGPSGTGKSTLLLMLLGIYGPDAGNLYLHQGESLVPIGSETRKVFSYIPQGNMLFSGTIMENLIMGKEDATDEEIERALKISCSYDFVKKLPLGLETKIGESGMGLSEGQQQRIAIARALIENSEVFLFDEATSALDEATEQELINNLKTINKTSIIVSHRKSLLTICEKCYFLDESGIREETLIDKK